MRTMNRTYIDIYCCVDGNSIYCPDCADKHGLALKYHKFEGTVPIDMNKEFWFCDDCGIQLEIDFLKGERKLLKSNKI